MSREKARRGAHEAKPESQRWGSSPRPPWLPHPLTTSPEPGLAELGWLLSGDGTLKAGLESVVDHVDHCPL